MTDHNAIAIDKDLLYSDIRDLRHKADMWDIPPSVLQKVAELETGKDYKTFHDPAQWWEDTAKTGQYILSSFTLYGLTSRLLTLHFGDDPFPDRDPCISPVWQSHVRDYYVDAADDIVYFVHGWANDWVDRDLLGGSGAGTARRKFEDKIIFMMTKD